VLSTGGFAYSPRLLETFSPEVARHYKAIQRLSTMGNDGAGLSMGRSVGAGVARMDSLYIARNIAPPESLLEGVLVNRSGERFVSEDAYVSLIGGELARQPGGDAWLLINAGCFWRSAADALTCGWQRFTYFGLPMLVNYILGGTRRGGNAATLARRIGVDPARLAATLRQHDDDIAAGRPDRVGKMEALRRPIGRGPIYAVNMSMRNPHALTKLMTLGGLKVDEATGGVLTDEGAPISGLYAAGMCAAGLHSNGYISGLSIADGVFSGRRAGRSAAAQATGDLAAPADGRQPVQARG